VRRIRLAGLLGLLATLAVPGYGNAQQPAPPQQASPNAAELQGWIAELQQIGTRLEQIQETALQDARLRADHEQLGADIRTAMQTIDPGLAASVERARTLQAEALAAQERGDAPRLEQLAEEAEAIRERFRTVQEQALAQPELAARVDSFQARVEKKMLEVDPDAQKLIQRFKALEQQIARAANGVAPRP
jgi:DNA repair exonuclease SbcCD ATPase subunit